MDERMRIALLIDADNAPAAKIDMVLAELARHGIANVRRAYGNWKSPTGSPPPERTAGQCAGCRFW